MKRIKYAAVIPLLLILFLGGVNIYNKFTWKEPTDGVIWRETSQGLMAVKIEENSPADFAGIKEGDILYEINNIDVNTRIDVARNLWIWDQENRRVPYQFTHEVDIISPKLSLTKKSVNPLYFYFALIGFTTIIIAVIVFVRARRPYTIPTIFYFVISFVFYCFYVFSPTGRLDTLDSVFYWLDKTAFLVFPPLLFHFFLLFPKRSKSLRKKIISIHLLYIPAVVLLLAKIFICLPNIFKFNQRFILQFLDTSEKLEFIHFSLFSLCTLVLVLYDTIKSTNHIIKKQLKWLSNGLALGVLPFTIFYAFPYILGDIPSKAAELTVVLQALLPLTFVYSISKYRLADLEVILKKAVPLIVSFALIAVVYLIVSTQTNLLPENRLQAIILGLLAIVLGATLFTPLKRLFQYIMDRLMYKRSFQYRRTLLSISQEISRERNLQKLSEAILEHIANALSLKCIALLLPEDNRKNVFHIMKHQGEKLSCGPYVKFDPRFYEYLKENEFLSFFSFSDKKDLQQKFEEMEKIGFYHFMPLKVEDKIIGCLGMGKKTDDTYLSREDWELLRTISSPVALALENAYLYNQIIVRALEFERLKDYSENIIESLTVGVVVLDKRGKITGWNRVMEDTFSRKKEEVLEKSLLELFGKKNYAALFPSDTQQEYRILTEITLNIYPGKEKIFDIVKTPLLDNNMNPYGTVIVFEDITDKIALQHQALQSEKLASIGLLSAGVAHEINTPLTGISSYVQLLQKKLLDSPHSEILKKIDNQTERVARIVKNLLNFARNPSDSAFHEVDLKENLQGIISLIDYKLKTMNIDLQLNIEPVKPIWAQGEQLQQVFINIILNAIDAMPDGGTLKIELFSKNKTAIIKITDTGTGIKEQYLPNIFDPFFTTKGVGKGTGLGLSISYAIIKEHEGQITVDSTPGKGSVFTINIPMNLEKKIKMSDSAYS
jgi:two-component system, NtrC family, sensor kinase